MQTQRRGSPDCGAENCAVVPDCPPVGGIGELDRIQIVIDAGELSRPGCSAVDRSQDRSTASNDPADGSIDEIDGGQVGRIIDLVVGPVYPTVGRDMHSLALVDYESVVRVQERNILNV